MGDLDTIDTNNHDYTLDYYSPFYNSDGSDELDELIHNSEPVDTFDDEEMISLLANDPFEDPNAISDYVADARPQMRRVDHVGYRNGRLGRYDCILQRTHVGAIVYLRVPRGLDCIREYTTEVRNADDITHVLNELPVDYCDAVVICDKLLDVITQNI